ncbi:MAG TPA: YicC family protein [Bacteroidales bacterium]|nr:YicC family protein [Bacteroidales bacterium]HQK36271.1 YicC family protein [Bacteroidales bacterium]
MALISMTGWGKTQYQLQDKLVTVEIKSINSRQFDLNLKIPFLYRDFESEIRSMISEKVARGKVDLVITQEYGNGSTISEINKEALKRYFAQISELAQEFGIPASDILFTAAMRFPEVVKTPQTLISEEEKTVLFEALSQALNHLVSFRVQEGEALEKDILLHIGRIEELLDQIAPYEQERIDAFREKLRKNLEEYLGKNKVDENRFEQEIIFQLEKIDITEEKTRLANHLKYFREVIKNEELQGRKLGFISQEIGREINTLGSKANHALIQKKVVEMKDALEKIKEQLLNIL